MFFNYSHRTKLDPVQLLSAGERSITKISVSLFISEQHTGQSWRKHWTLYLDCGASLAARWAGHPQFEPAAGEQAEWSAHWDVWTGSQPQGSWEAEGPSSASVPAACCSAVAAQKVSGALESAAIEVQHVCLFQELSLGESYLQLVEQHRLKYFNKLHKNQFKRPPTDQALFLINTSASILQTTASLLSLFEGKFYSFYSQNT